MIITVVLLGVALLAAIAGLVYFFLILGDANGRIDEQERELQEQRELIDKKETFGAAMEALLDTASELDGVPLGSLIDAGDYQTMATRAWTDRWDPAAVDRQIEKAWSTTEDLEELLSAAREEAGTNTSGTTSEVIIDQLGSGFVNSLLDNAKFLCGSQALACVREDEPLTVHFDAGDNALPYMTDWIRTGVAYHEFAHILQLANPNPTETALAAFGGDHETMADCYALTYLDGWTLEHRIKVSRWEYWDVSIGYGYTCDEAQRQVIRDWNSQLALQIHPVAQ